MGHGHHGWASVLLIGALLAESLEGLLGNLGVPGINLGPLTQRWFSDLRRYPPKALELNVAT